MRLKTLVNSAGLLLVATALAGCGSMDRDALQTGGIPQDYRTTHPIVLSEKEHTLDVPVASGARELNLSVRSNVRGFAAEFADAGTGALFVIMPTGSPNEHAVSLVRDDIVAALVNGGASRKQIVFQHYDASAHGSAAAVRLSYNAVTAATEPCGAWPDDIAKTQQNNHYQAYGCATQSNLAAIIANPVDLMGPRQSSPIDATERAAVIDAYQKGPVGGASEVTY